MYSRKLSLSQNENTLKRVRSLKRLCEVNRVENIQRIKRSTVDLEIKKFLYSLTQKQNLVQPENSVVQNSYSIHHSFHTSERKTTAEKPQKIIQYKVKPFV